MVMGAALAAGSAAVACSLNLDESKIPGEGPIDASGSDGLATDTGPVGDGAPGSVYIPCKTTPECGAAPNACVIPRCDTARGVCVYDECGSTPGSCTSKTCDPDALTCSASLSTYGFFATSIALPPGPLGCNGSVSRCFAASFPFVFVGTAGGIVIYPVANPVGGTPKAVAIDGVPFPPAWIVASGARVWFLGNKVVSAPGFKQPVAWLDVPTDPTVKRMAAQSVTLETSQQDIQAVRAADDGAILVTLVDPSGSAPTTRLQPPLTADAPLTFYPLGLPPQSQPITTSGDRVVGVRLAPGTAGTPTRAYVTLVSGAGTAGTQSLPEVELTPFPLAPGYATTGATSGSGGVVLAGEMYNEDGDAGPIGPKNGRLTWVLDDANATKVSGTPHVDYEGIDGTGANTIGPVAWVDSTTALVTALAPTDAGNQTKVQAVTRGPGTPAVVGASHNLNGPPGAYAYSGSAGFGYALGVDNAGGTTQPTVYIFAPSCK